MNKHLIIPVLLIFMVNMSYGQLKIDPGSNKVKIGNITTAPARLLHISGTDGVFRIDRQGNSGPAFLLSAQNGNHTMKKNFVFSVKGLGTNNGYFYIGDYGTSLSDSNTRRLVVDNDGTLIVGNTAISHSAKLFVEGTAFKNTGGDTWNTTSDLRLKQNISPFQEGLSKILQINPVHFEYNGKAHTPKGSPQIGVIAQDLQMIAPHMVSEFSVTTINKESLDGAELRTEQEYKKTYLSVNASSVKWMLVNAVKEQQKMIEELRETVRVQGEMIEQMRHVKTKD